MKTKIVILILLAMIGVNAFAQAPNNARMLSTPNAQTGTTYTFVAADTTRVVTFSNASSVAVTLPNGATFGFGAGTVLAVVNLGAGTVTITCSSCTINGAATLALSQNSGADIYGGSGTPAVNYIALPSPTGSSFAGVSANNNFTGTNNFTSLNGHFWAGPGATPTIATQEAAAIAAGGGIVDIHQLYTGTESANCTTINGVKYWAGNSTVQIIDWRANGGACFYSVGLNSQAAQLGNGHSQDGLIINYNQTNLPSNTTTRAFVSESGLTGPYPAQSVSASVNEAKIYGSLTSNGGGSMIASESDATIVSTGQTITRVVGASGNVLMEDAGTSTNVTEADGLFGSVANTSSAPGGSIARAYGAHLTLPTAGTNKNYALLADGRIEISNDLVRGAVIDMQDTSGVDHQVIGVDVSNNTILRAAAVGKGPFVQDSTGNTTQGLTLKKGSGAGNYTNATTTYTVADSTNLCLTLTIPTGWKLGVSASGGLSTATAAVVAQAALTDNAACSTANAGILVETAPIQGAAIGVADAFALDWVITGDGASHNIALQFKTSNAADTASLINSSATITPTLKFELMPSN